MTLLELREIGKEPVRESKEGKKGDKYANSKVALARFLGCDEKTVAAKMKLPGCPGRVTGGGYDIEAWRAWMPSVLKPHGGRTDIPMSGQEEINRIAAKRAQEEYEEWQFERDVKRGKYVLKESVKREASECYAVLWREFDQRMTHSAIDEIELCETVEEKRAVMKRHRDELRDFLHKGDW